MITCIGQLKGPFKKGENLGTKMFQDPEIGLISSAFKIGIFSVPEHVVAINGIDFEIGKTGMLEIRDTNITSIQFKQDEDLNSYIDYMAEK